MARTLIVCLIASQLSGTLFADEISSERTASSSAAVTVSSELSAPELFATSSINVFSIDGQSQTAGGTLSATLFTAASPFVANLPTDGESVLAASPRLWQAALNGLPGETNTSLAQRRGGYRGGRGYRGRHSGAAAALAVGAVAAVTGAAILVYANRPDCRVSQRSSGCGYGTKVVGGAVLAGGVVGLVIAAASW
jgi:hypothetical protein